MPITIDEVKEKIDILFQTQDELDEAFASAPFEDELNRAISYVNGGVPHWVNFRAKSLLMLSEQERKNAE